MTSLAQDSQSRQSLVLNQLQQQATELGTAAAAMPMRVQRMDELLGAMESGEFKLRVRVLEAERAARRAGVMQVRSVSSPALHSPSSDNACETSQVTAD
jgi:hypothetical protein